MEKAKLNYEEAATVALGIISIALRDLMTKRVDYSGTKDPFANLRGAEFLFDTVSPAMGAITRLMDKVKRIAGRAERGAVAGESVYTNDMADIINYVGIIAGLILEEETPENRTAILSGMTKEAEKLPNRIQEVLARSIALNERA